MVARVMAAFEAFQQRLMTLHAVEFTNLEITMAQAKLLYVVTAAGELSMSETAHRLGVTVSTASGAVDRLVELGLLERSDDPANRRQVRVSVTDTGRRSLEQLQELNTPPASRPVRAHQRRGPRGRSNGRRRSSRRRHLPLLPRLPTSRSRQPVPLPSLTPFRDRGVPDGPQSTDDDSNLALATRGLRKSYGSRLALDGLDLSVPTGVVYGFLGPNGAGKTTTMRVLTGLIHPDGGAIEMFGRPFNRRDRRRLFDVGALVESAGLLPIPVGPGQPRVPWRPAARRRPLVGRRGPRDRRPA